MAPNPIISQIYFFCDVTLRYSITVYTHEPLPIDGRAIVLMFFSSAKVRTFLTAFSKLSTEESFPHVGLWTWITYCAGKLCPSQIAAMGEAKTMFSLLTFCGNFSNSADINISISTAPQVCQVSPHAQFKWQSDILDLLLISLPVVKENFGYKVEKDKKSLYEQLEATETFKTDKMTRIISSPPWMGWKSIAGLPPALILPVPIYTPGWREALWEYSVLIYNITQCLWPGLKTRPLVLRASTWTVRPLHLHEAM